MVQLELFPETVEIHVIVVWWLSGDIDIEALGPKERLITKKSSYTLLQKTFPGLVMPPRRYLPASNISSTMIKLTARDWAYWIGLGNKVDWITTSRY